MTTTAPTLQQRPAQPYAAIRANVTMAELPHVVAPLFPEMFGWLGRQGLAPAGAPFIRYLVIDMEAELEIEVGVPVPAGVAGDERVVAGELPAGRYAALLHTGPPEQLVAANAELQKWAAEQGLRFDRVDDRWAGRVEHSLTNPAEVPDRAQWQTEVAYLVADDADS